MTYRAYLLPNAKTGFIDSNGKPLSGGSVWFYIPNTSTLKSTWQDAAQTILNTNPIVLDARGEAIIWGSGTYRQVVYDQFGNLIWDQITEDANANLTGNMTDAVFTAGDGTGNTFIPGTTTQLTLPVDPGSLGNTWIFFDALYQTDDQVASLANSVLAFTAPIPVGISEVTIKIGTTISIGTPSPGTVTGDSIKLPLVINDTQSNTTPGAQPFTDITINRSVSTPGTLTSQNGGFIVYNNVQAAVTHNEYGIFSVLNNYGQDASAQPVGFYSQANSLGGGASPLWAGVFEVKNVTSSGPGSNVDSVLTGIEVDVANGNEFSTSNLKIGVECIGYGGFECNDAFSVHAANDTYANGTYETGGWRTALDIYPNSLNPTLGIGIDIQSDHGSGISISGTSENFAINLATTAASTCGINIGPNYTTPIALAADRKIEMNSLGSSEGISYVSAEQAIVLSGVAIGVSGHTVYGSATAGGSGALPADVSGYLGVYVNGTLCKIPFYNA